MIILIDTSAWVEYLLGSEKGRRVKDIVEESGNTIVVPTIVIAELSSKLAREGKDTEIVYKLLGIGNFRIVEGLSFDMAVDAGRFHADAKKPMLNISLVDVLLMKIADKMDAAIVTTDRHFKLYHKAIIL